jgi:hypothetical protein
VPNGSAAAGFAGTVITTWPLTTKRTSFTGTQGAAPTVYAADLDDDQLWEYVICNNRVFLCFERWGARLVKAFVFDPDLNGGDAVAVGFPSNPPEETARTDNNRFFRSGPFLFRPERRLDGFRRDRAGDVARLAVVSRMDASPGWAQLEPGARWCRWSTAWTVGTLYTLRAGLTNST